MSPSEHPGPAAASGRAPAPRRQAFIRWALVLRAVFVLALGVALFASGARHAVVGNLLATFWLASALLTLRWSRDHRGSSRSRLATLAGLAGVVAAVVLLARFIIEAMISLDTTLAILGIAAIVVGTLRVVGAFRDEPGDRPRPALRLVLGASEIGIGVVWIAVDDVSRTVTVVGGLCALVVGTSMLVGALDLRRRSLPGVRP